MERTSNATANRIYDEFEPLSNWKSEKGFETLTIYLPGLITQQTLALFSSRFWFINCFFNL